MQLARRHRRAQARRLRHRGLRAPCGAGAASAALAPWPAAQWHTRTAPAPWPPSPVWSWHGVGGSGAVACGAVAHSHDIPSTAAPRPRQFQRENPSASAPCSGWRPAREASGAVPHWAERICSPTGEASSARAMLPCWDPSAVAHQRGQPRLERPLRSVFLAVLLAAPGEPPGLSPSLLFHSFPAYLLQLTGGLLLRGASVAVGGKEDARSVLCGQDPARHPWPGGAPGRRSASGGLPWSTRARAPPVQRWAHPGCEVC